MWLWLRWRNGYLSYNDQLNWPWNRFKYTDLNAYVKGLYTVFIQRDECWYVFFLIYCLGYIRGIFYLMMDYHFWNISGSNEFSALINGYLCNLASIHLMILTRLAKSKMMKLLAHMLETIINFITVNITIMIVIVNMITMMIIIAIIIYHYQYVESWGWKDKNSMFDLN